jgi:D-3-phosphoglycerate dehydrogenase
VPEGAEDEPHAILLRSHKLKSEEVATSVRAIARCGAGTNNIPIDAMTQRGIPVFNTPGANANSVKELVLAGLLLASRDIVGGINHVNNTIVKEEADAAAINKRVEKDKSKFGGGEILGKTLAVCGLGNIGAMVADAAIALGMNVVGYDPKISVEAAWRLPNSVRKVTSLEAAFAEADYVSINMPYIKGVTHHVISEAVLAQMKPSCHILNFARGEIVDGPALKRLYAKGHAGKYVCDFPDEHLQDEPKFVCIPHLGASTAEAEDNCAEMAARQIINFLETGTIVNSVNFPNAALATQSTGTTRLCIINENKPGVLGQITTLLGGMNVNIAQQLNTSRDTIAYNVIDLDDFPKDSTENLQKELLAMDGVLSTRFIFTGSVAEGPAAFYVKDVSVCG